MRIPTRPPISIEIDLQVVKRPPTWRNDHYELSYLLVDREVQPDELVDLMQWTTSLKMPNPRIITPEVVRWSSLFHPRFYAAIQYDGFKKAQVLDWVDKSLPTDVLSLSRFWLQSVLFLSGVTLSAAVVQSRFSSGTLGSKLDRLWEAGTLASTKIAQELEPLQLHDRVLEIAANRANELKCLLDIRETFMKVLSLIAPSIGSVEVMHKSVPPAHFDKRFGFVETLRAKLGENLQGVVVYGSSISSINYADIDALVIVTDPKSALSQLAGASPIWQGKELNLGIYSPDELMVMQRLSGDNLTDYGMCVWGEVLVIRKPVAYLLARNLSFGVVRQRQQLGMLSREVLLADPRTQDRKNLVQYFVKIPANVAKGTFGAVGKRLPKEQIHDWLLSTIGFDTPMLQAEAVNGNSIKALASSVLATGHTMSTLNKTLSIVRDRISNSSCIRE